MLPHQSKFARSIEPPEPWKSNDPLVAWQHCINDVQLLRLILRLCIRNGGRVVNSEGDVVNIGLGPLAPIIRRHAMSGVTL